MQTDLYPRPLLDDIRDLALTFGGPLRCALEADDVAMLDAAFARIAAIALAARFKIANHPTRCND